MLQQHHHRSVTVQRVFDLQQQPCQSARMSVRKDNTAVAANTYLPDLWIKLRAYLRPSLFDFRRSGPRLELSEPCRAGPRFLRSRTSPSSPRPSRHPPFIQCTCTLLPARWPSSTEPDKAAIVPPVLLVRIHECTSGRAVSEVTDRVTADRPIR